MLPVKPTNQASRYALVVPVLPAALMPSRIARLAVPSSTTLLIIRFMSMATCGEHLNRFLAVAVPTPDQITGTAAHFEHGVRGHRLPEIGKHRVAGGVIEHRHLVGADWHGGRIGQRRAQAGLARGVLDLGAPYLRVAVAERDLQ